MNTPARSPQVILITGASSGIGQACAAWLTARGQRVFGTSRAPTARTHAGTFPLLPLDLTDDRSVQATVAQVLAEAGRLDVVINNAGYGLAGPLEETTPEEAQALLEVHLLGVLRLCRAVLPTMRARRSGRIINIGSIAARLPLPYQGLYCASKAALAALSETLRLEVAPFGIQVVLVEPGDLHTGFTHHRQRVAAPLEDSPYRAAFEQALAIMEHDETQGPPPLVVARLVERIIQARAPRRCYRVGPWLQRLSPLLYQLLPGRAGERLLSRHYQGPG